jgi:hypothetical protein
MPSADTTRNRRSYLIISDTERWEKWQSDIVTLLQSDFGGEVLRDICLDDIDWPSWRDFYVQGKSPRAAIERALERDL